MNYKNNLTRNILYCYLPIVVLFATIRTLSAFGLLNFLGKTGEYVLTIVIQIGLLFSTAIFGFALIQKCKIKEVFKFYGFRKINWKAILISIAIGIVVYFLNIFVSTFFNAFISIFGYKSSGGGSTTGSYPVWLFLLNILMTAILPAICEETAHRGMLLKGLSPMGQKWAIIISSLLFGLLHLNIEQVFYATLIGFLLGYVSSICENIYPAMIIHFMNNFLSVFMGFSSANHLGPEMMFTYLNQWLANNTILAIVFMMAVTAILFFLLKFLVKLLFRVTTVRRVNAIEEEIMKELTKEAYLQDVKDVTEGKMPTETREPIPFERFDEMFQRFNKKQGYSSEIDHVLMNDESQFKLNKITKTMLITVFVIVSVITFFTFIWGIL